MKKNLLYLFTVLCTLSFFTACGDDDDPVDESWKELTGTYDGSNLSLTLNSSALFATEGRSVVFTPSSETAGVMKLNNAVPEQASVEIPVTLTKNGNEYAFTGSGVAAGSATIGITGALTVSGTKAAQAIVTATLKADVTRTVASAVTGQLKLNYLNGVGDVYVEATIDDPTLGPLLNQMVPSLIGGALAGKVSAVTVDLSDKGAMAPTWTKLGETTPTTLASIPTVGPMFGTLINMFYVATNDKLFIGLDKGLLTNPALTATVFPMIKEKIGIDVSVITGLMTDMNGYLMIPLSYKQSDNLITFYADKTLIMTIVNSGLLNSFIPADYQALLPTVLPLLQSANTVNIGLRFKK